jgi:phosphoribosylformylglycinamidine synthase
MILFFRTPQQSVIAVNSAQTPSHETIDKLIWLFGGGVHISQLTIEGWFTGPRKEMLTPWSTNAVEITQNMGIEGILRMEEFFPVSGNDASFDHMLQALYQGLNQEIFSIYHDPEPIMEVHDIAAYNEQEGLALSEDEIDYLNSVSVAMDRKLTDSEVFGFSQVNSEHCRHKIFNGTFIIDGVEMESSLFQMIKRTSKENPNKIVSAYRDNCSFVQGPVVEQFAPVPRTNPTGLR